jgi:hypothetical protein
MLVRWDQTQKLFVALSAKPWLTPFSSPAPEPSMIISIRIPQNTPNAVKNVRILLAPSAVRISRQ